MSIVLNERECAIEALQKCVLDTNPLETLGRVAKYYRAEGYKKAEIHSMLESFMLKCDPTINIVKWQDAIDRQIKDADKFPLIELDGIPITQSELDICSSLSGKQMKRLMFALICLAKFCNAVSAKNNNWVNRSDKELFKMANVVTPIRRQSLMINDLREAGLIRFSRKVDNININVLCIDNIGEPVLVVTDYRNLGYQYMKYYGEPYFECASCGIVIKRTGKNHKYCSDCAADIHRQKARDNFKNRAQYTK